MEAAARDQERTTQKELLLASTIVDDGDGDPMTIGILHPDGTSAGFEMMGSPDFVRSLTVEDLAQILIPDVEVSG